MFVEPGEFADRSALMAAIAVQGYRATSLGRGCPSPTVLDFKRLRFDLLQS